MRIANRRGFTLVELLVAVVLVNVGLLALVGGSAAVVRRHTAVRTRAIATQLAKARIELLAAVCGATSGSASGPAGFVESWTVSALENGVRELSERVTYPTTGGATGVASIALQTRVAC